MWTRQQGRRAVQVGVDWGHYGHIDIASARILDHQGRRAFCARGAGIAIKPDQAGRQMGRAGLRRSQRLIGGDKAQSHISPGKRGLWRGVAQDAESCRPCGDFTRLDVLGRKLWRKGCPPTGCKGPGCLTKTDQGNLRGVRKGHAGPPALGAIAPQGVRISTHL